MWRYGGAITIVLGYADVTWSFHDNCPRFYTFLVVYLSFLYFIISLDFGDTVQNEETRGASGLDTESFKTPPWCITDKPFLA